MFSSSFISTPSILYSWLLGDVTDNGPGNPDREVVAYFVRKATARPQMPAAFIRIYYHPQAYPDPNSGEFPYQQPARFQ